MTPTLMMIPHANKGGGTIVIITWCFYLEFNSPIRLRIKPYYEQMMNMCGQCLENAMQTIHTLEHKLIRFHGKQGRLVSYVVFLCFLCIFSAFLSRAWISLGIVKRGLDYPWVGPYILGRALHEPIYPSHSPLIGLMEARGKAHFNLILVVGNVGVISDNWESWCHRR